MNDQYIIYAPNGELQDSIQTSGVIDISNLNRQQIKDLATSAAGWSGENGGFSANDILSGQADVQGRFTRHEDLFRRKFNKQLNRNLRHTAKMQEIENAKNGDVTALGRYQNYAKEDVAKVLAPLVVGVPMAGTGVLGTLAGGVKSIYANPMMRFGLDMYGTTDGIINLFTDNGVQKTIRAIQEGDYLGAIKSGAGDIFDVVSIVDLPKSIKGLSNLKNYRKPYSFKYVDNIGDEGSRWKHINDTDVNLTYKKYVDEGVVDPVTLPKTMVTPTSTFKSDNSLEDFILINDKVYGDETEVQWLIDNLKGKSKAEAEAFLAEISSPKSPYYNDYVKASDASYLRDYLNNTGATIDAKKKIVERGREVEKALNFVADGIHARHPLIREDADFITQLASSERTYRKPKFSFDFSLTGSDYNAKLSKDRKHITMGWLDPGEGFHIPGNNAVLRNGPVAAHEGAHGYRKYNEKGNETVKYQFLTDSQKESYFKRLSVDSPRYKNDYSSIPERAKKLLTPTMDVDDHDIELSEGYSDAWGTRFNLFDKGISSAALDPTKKYTYLDLIRYKMTPIGMTDRFIIQRGGWWKGWKQQLDALNEVYQNGGKLCQKIK